MEKENKILVFYYAALLLVMLSWTDTENAPNIVFRILFLLATVIPALVYDRAYMAPVVICFSAITQNGFAHSYMPDNLLYYIALLTLGLFSFRSSKHNAKMPLFLLLICIYITLIDIITNASVEKVTLTFIVSLLFVLYTSKDSGRDIDLWSLSFVITSFVLSGLFLLNREKFAEVYYTQGLERTSWMDPNYFGMVIGMGYTVALLQLMKPRISTSGKISSLLLKSLSIGTVAISAIVLILNASRGALLAAGIATIGAMAFSKAKIGSKIIIILIMIVGLVLLYQNSYFDLLEYRMENDRTEGGNGRYFIWRTKLNLFFEGDIINMIFGYGQDQGLKLGFGSLRRGTHNDYVSFLVEYGFIGFIMFLSMLFKPIKTAFKTREASTVTILILYLAICCLSLEPISGAYIPYLFFYIYIVLIACSNKRSFILNSKY